MRRQFITFSEGEEYNKLSSVLKESITTFSQYGITSYSAKDFDIVWNPKSWPSGYVHMFKILSCIKALKEFDDVVWIDTDVVVTKNIDLIWNYKNENYPLLPRYRFYNFIRWPHDKSSLFSVQQSGKLSELSYGDYLQACCMKFDRSSLEFLEEVLSHFDNFNPKDFPVGDEVIINYLLRQKNYTSNLGDIFLCSQYFSAQHISKFLSIPDNDLQTYQDLFNPNIHPEDESHLSMYDSNGQKLQLSYSDFYRLGLINCSNNILFLHGNKNEKTHRFYLERMLSALNNHLEFNNKTNLCEIMTHFGSDKATSHNYTKIYDHYFSKYVNKSINLFELGIGTNKVGLASSMGESGMPGASLRAWSSYFPLANIYGADIDHDILFQTERISTFWCDQRSPDVIRNMWNNENLKDKMFEVIIDDGLHEYEANLIFFENSIHKIKIGGYYVIEDLMPDVKNLFKENLEYLRQKWTNLQFNLIELKGREGRIDNNLLFITRIS